MYTQQTAPKRAIGSSTANAKIPGWLGLTVQHEGAETTDEHCKEWMHIWLTAQLDVAPEDTNRCGTDLQATTALIIYRLWPSADLNALPDSWKASCFAHDYKGTVKADCSLWG